MFQLIASYVIFLLIVRCGSHTWREPRQSTNIAGLHPSKKALTVLRIDSKGNTHITQVQKQYISNELNLHLRDLRVVDPSLPKQIQATIIARPRAILFCIENLKAIVMHNQALIFNPFIPEVEEMLPLLQQMIIQYSEAGYEKGSDDSPRFEHLVIESALHVTCSNLFQQVCALSPALTTVLNGLRAESQGLDVFQTQVEELLPHKNKLDTLRKRVREIRKTIIETLNNDEDLSMMYLKGDSMPELEMEEASTSNQIMDIRPRIKLKEKRSGFKHVDDDLKHDKRISTPSQLDTMSLEMLFENYLNEIEWISSEIEEVVDEVINTEEYVALQLDLLRNKIMKFELLLTVSTFVVTCGALITGIFGMNLKNNFELHSSMFYVVSLVIIGSMGLSLKKILQYGQSQKLF